MANSFRGRSSNWRCARRAINKPITLFEQTPIVATCQMQPSSFYIPLYSQVNKLSHRSSPSPLHFSPILEEAFLCPDSPSEKPTFPFNQERPIPSLSPSVLASPSQNTTHIMLRSLTRTPTMATMVQKQAVRSFMTSVAVADRPRSKALGAVRTGGGSKDSMDISNLEDFQFDDSTTVRRPDAFTFCSISDAGTKGGTWAEDIAGTKKNAGFPCCIFLDPGRRNNRTKLQEATWA